MKTFIGFEISDWGLFSGQKFTGRNAEVRCILAGSLKGLFKSRGRGDGG